MDEVLKKHSTSLLVVITDTAPIFCAKNKLTHKDVLHILPQRKGNALSIQFNRRVVTVGYSYKVE